MGFHKCKVCVCMRFTRSLAIAATGDPSQKAAPAQSTTETADDNKRDRVVSKAVALFDYAQGGFVFHVRIIVEFGSSSTLRLILTRPRTNLCMTGWRFVAVDS